MNQQSLCLLVFPFCLIFTVLLPSASSAGPPASHCVQFLESTYTSSNLNHAEAYLRLVEYALAKGKHQELLPRIYMAIESDVPVNVFLNLPGALEVSLSQAVTRGQLTELPAEVWKDVKNKFSKLAAKSNHQNDVRAIGRQESRFIESSFSKRHVWKLGRPPASEVLWHIENGRYYFGLVQDWTSQTSGTFKIFEWDPLAPEPIEIGSFLVNEMLGKGLSLEIKALAWKWLDNQVLVYVADNLHFEVASIDWPIVKLTPQLISFDRDHGPNAYRGHFFKVQQDIFLLIENTKRNLLRQLYRLNNTPTQNGTPIQSFINVGDFYAGEEIELFQTSSEAYWISQQRGSLRISKVVDGLLRTTQVAWDNSQLVHPPLLFETDKRISSMAKLVTPSMSKTPRHIQGFKLQEEHVRDSPTEPERLVQIDRRQFAFPETKSLGHPHFLTVRERHFMISTHTGDMMLWEIPRKTLKPTPVSRMIKNLSKGDLVVTWTKSFDTDSGSYVFVLSSTTEDNTSDRIESLSLFHLDLTHKKPQVELVGSIEDPQILSEFQNGEPPFIATSLLIRSYKDPFIGSSREEHFLPLMRRNGELVVFERRVILTEDKE